MTFYVYALCQPGTGEIRYIGKTNNLATRLDTHRSESASRDMRQWVRDVGAPDLRVLESHEDESIAYSAESRLTWASGDRRDPRWPGLGDRLRATRKSRRITGTVLADSCGTTQGHISKIETGERELVSAELALVLARALNVSLEWLITGESPTT